jgi:predicted phage terminase large subunit-like protein
MSVELQRTVQGYENYIQRKGIDEEVIYAMLEASTVAIKTEKDIQYGLVLTDKTKRLIDSYTALHTDGGSIWDLEAYAQKHETEYKLVNWEYDLLWLEAKERFESFMLYLEKRRPVEERFYQPRIIPLRRVANGIQDLVDDKLDELFVNCPSRVGKTQIVKLGFVWYGSKFPEKSNLYTAYSDKITGGFYDGILEIMTDPTYTYADIFPENVEKKLITDGKDTTIDLIRKKTYPTFTMRSIYGTLNGACDCSGMGVSDDLFSGIEEALSLDRQITVWGKFDNNFMKRLKRKAKLINMGTRWAPLDVQGRRRNLLENKPEYKNRRWNAIVIPALNENEESNFDYPYNLGYSTEDYLMIRSSFEENDDMASWYAQDQQEPIDRHGALFTTDNMKYFNPTQDLPDRVPDRIFAAVDPAYGGGDFVAMPICYQFSTDYFVVDVVYNNGDKEITVPEVTQRIAFHLEKFAPKTAEVHFEETKTTMEYRTLCQKEWEKLNAPVNATHDAAPNNISKADRIKNHAPDIRKLYFIDRDHRTKEYNQYFQNILTFKTEGKNKHDDGIDATAQLCDMIYGRKRTRNTVIIQSPI